MDLKQIVLVASTGLLGVMRSDMSEVLMKVAKYNNVHASNAGWVTKVGY
jgi:hypothetical protein